MNDCLITKLNGVVNNDDLEELGALKIKVARNNDNHSNINGHNAITLRVYAEGDPLSGNGFFTVKDGTIYGRNGTAKSGTTDYLFYTPEFFVPTGSYGYIMIDDKYSVSQIEATDVVSISDLRYSPNLQILSLKYNELDIDLSSILDPVGNPILKYLILSDSAESESNISASTAFLGQFTNLERLYVTNCKNVSGQITDFALLTKLEGLLINAISISTTPAITGTIESLLEGQYNQGGRRSGTLYIQSASYAVSFHGTYDLLNATFSANGITVTDRNNTPIGTYNGSTWTYPG